MKMFVYPTIAAAALVAAGLMIAPTAQAAEGCVDAVTAGGWVPAGTDLSANFGLNARQRIRGGETNLTGHLNYIDGDNECHVVGHEVLSYTVLDEFCREIVYDVTITLDDIEILPEWEYIAVVEVCDLGEPGAADFFSIQVIDVTDPLDPIVVTACSASGTLAGGNVQLHLGGDCP